jgi:hypothetical protein
MPKPDRYTVQSVHIEDVPVRITEAKNLGLKFLVMPENHPASDRVNIYLFFDSQGKKNFLLGVYDGDADECRRLASQEADDAALGKAVREYFYEVYGI